MQHKCKYKLCTWSLCFTTIHSTDTHTHKGFVYRAAKNKHGAIVTASTEVKQLGAFQMMAAEFEVCICTGLMFL